MAAMVAGDFRPVPEKLCPACLRRGEWPGQPCPECKLVIVLSKNRSSA